MLKYLSPLFIAAVMMVPIHAQQPIVKIAPVPLKPTSITDGKQMYQNYCASCHGATGIGNGSAAPALKTAPSNLTLLAAKNNGVFPTDHVSGVLQFGATHPAHGSAEMPMWGDLLSSMSTDGREESKLRIRNITDYLKTLQKN